MLEGACIVPRDAEGGGGHGGGCLKGFFLDSRGFGELLLAAILQTRGFLKVRELGWGLGGGGGVVGYRGEYGDGWLFRVWWRMRKGMEVMA